MTDENETHEEEAPFEDAKFWELCEEMAQLELEIDAVEAEGKDPEILADLWDKHIDLTTASANKLQGYIHFIDSLVRKAALAKAEFESIQNIYDRAKKRMQVAENRIKSINEYITHCMISHDLDKLEAASGTVFKLRKPTYSVDVSLDAKYSTWDDDLYSIEYKPNKSEIKKRYKDVPEDERPHGVIIKEKYKVDIK